MRCQKWNKTGEFLLTFEHGYLTVFDDFKNKDNCIMIPPEFFRPCQILTRDFSINWIIRSLYYIFPRFNG